MMFKSRSVIIIVAVLLTLGLVAAVVSAQTTTPSAADSPAHFSDLIKAAQASGKPITFDFVVPLVSGERNWTMPDDNAHRELSAVGADYVCFSEPWNGGNRQRCTSFSNITSITFVK